jgi:branched-subunit amino acid transport protein
MIDLEHVLTMLALALVTLITRCFFFISEHPWELPSWAERGLRYAPIAALTVVIVPEIVTVQGHLITDWRDARWPAVLASGAFFVLQRGRSHSILGTIVTGMAVYLPLHLVLGW